jgi:hypothetical protein
MLIESLSYCCSARKSALTALVALCAAVLPFQVSAQEIVKLPPEPPKLLCGPEIKAQVAQALDAVKDAEDADVVNVENELYVKYQNCAQDVQLIPPTGFYQAARECSAAVSYLGSIFFEEMPCCGYDPQRRTFACPVKIKQQWGYGAAQLPGSREYVLHCVADASGALRPVGSDSVHLADALNNQPPPWQFAVVANATFNLSTVYPMNGATRRARSILSWGLRPTGCEYRPIWGNVINYPIRLDQ